MQHHCNVSIGYIDDTETIQRWHFNFCKIEENIPEEISWSYPLYGWETKTLINSSHSRIANLAVSEAVSTQKQQYKQLKFNRFKLLYGHFSIFDYIWKQFLLIAISKNKFKEKTCNTGESLRVCMENWILLLPTFNRAEMLSSCFFYQNLSILHTKMTPWCWENIYLSQTLTLQNKCLYLLQ